MNKAIEQFLKDIKVAKITKGSIRLGFKHGKETIKMSFVGKDRHIKALKEIVKYL